MRKGKKQDIKVDEVEIKEKEAMMAFLQTVLHLSFAELCLHPISCQSQLHCMGCDNSLSNQKDHDCFNMEEEEKWNLFYNKAKHHVDPDRVWETVHGVCHMSNVSLHSSWRNYLFDLYKLPWTTVFLYRLQLIPWDQYQSPIDKILKVVSFTSSSGKALPCPKEFSRKDHESMDIDS